jgi:hypothetical protein
MNQRPEEEGRVELDVPIERTFDRNSLVKSRDSNGC